MTGVQVWDHIFKKPKKIEGDFFTFVLFNVKTQPKSKKVAL